MLGCRRQLDVLDTEFRQRIDDRIGYRCQPRRDATLAAARMPSGLVVDGTSLISVRNSGRLSARGIA
jgi:hypothetical protein